MAEGGNTKWPELWAIALADSRLSVSQNPAGTEICIGIGRTSAPIGTGLGIAAEDARAMAFAVLEATGGVPQPEPATDAKVDPSEWMLRQQTRQQLVGKGIPASHVDVVVDLAFTAAQRAADQLHKFVFADRDERVAITAIGVAIGITHYRLDLLQEAMIDAARKNGRAIKGFAVGGVHG
ncbi:hypothetical protein WBP07_12495 [Novosphingobium sp. BL-8A]|uniref:hypothetical protein n=1 Tax=Novosphingobium sp. BL-8A TaxID=3127639 RepID=UPI0037562D56